MAGIGVKLNRIYGKGSIVMNLLGFGYSMMVTIAPMIVVIGNIMLMSIVLGYDKLGYADRNLFSATILYIFIFSLLTAAPFNAVLSRYMSDVIYEERYEDIMPCYYTGLILNIALSCLLGIPFCVREYLVGGVPLYFVFTSYCGYISLVLVFYSMLYLSICKDYMKISLYFFGGMLFAFVTAVVLVKVFDADLVYSMLLAMSMGFLLTAILEMSTVRRYFKKNSNRYRKVFLYFKKYWQLIVVNAGYTLGLYIHNFVFWNTRMRMVVADSFVMAPIYDMATCLAMFTNISATIIFISRVEMHFHERYKMYSEAVTGGRWQDILNTKDRMFRQLSIELLNLVRIQLIISVVVYLIMVVFLPRLGFSGTTLRIYPCLAAGYFILFVMYAEVIFLYYFNDLNGAILTAVSFCLVTFLGSQVSRNLPEIWYGLGLVVGGYCGVALAYVRLRWVERHLDEHIFCKGTLFPMNKGKRPDAKVFDRKNEAVKTEKVEKADKAGKAAKVKKAAKAEMAAKVETAAKTEDIARTAATVEAVQPETTATRVEEAVKVETATAAREEEAVKVETAAAAREEEAVKAETAPTRVEEAVKVTAPASAEEAVKPDTGSAALTPEMILNLAEELAALRRLVMEQDKEIRRLKEEKEVS